MDAGPVELVQQQEMLGAATVLAGHLYPLPTGTPIRSTEDEYVQFDTERFRPAGQLRGFALKTADAPLGQVTAVTEPDVEVTGHGMAKGSRAAHQEHGVQIRFALAFILQRKSPGQSTSRIDGGR